ncbi:hypothetical protein K5X82_02475 [Halosquirtibacter xylanolyticus]|uniref:hypothetical protein n=1 Tax=Halosquirtibacter xylanolyticus TaxID=3374599 RepID=UPI003747B545|nr:hypothetical protein K5X82_02475 [Prolixibacteraceae bacterium]
MKRIETILSILFVVILVIRVAMVHHMTSTKYFVLVAFAIFYTVWGILGFKDISPLELFTKRAYRHYGRYHRIYPILNGVSLSLIAIGIVFKIRIQMDYYIVLWIGVLMTLLILFMDSYGYFKSHKIKIPRPIYRSIGWVILGLFFLNSTGVGMVKLRYRHYPEVIRAYELHLKNPEDIRYIQAFRRYVKRVEDADID